MAVACLGDNRVYDLQVKDEHVVTPNFRNVHVDQATDVYFGDRNIFQGPVTIEKIVLTKGGRGKGEAPRDPDHGYRKDGPEPNTSSTAAPSPCRRNSESGTTSGRMNVNERICLVLRLLKSKSTERPLVTTAIVIAVILCLIAGVAVIVAVADRGLTVLTRSQWGAIPPTDATTPLVTPVPYVIIHHTATVNCSTIEECIPHVRFIQEFHTGGKQFYDIGYNFLIGGDGTVFEGRGWTVEGAHSYGNNYKSIGIAFIGTFNDIKPPDVQMSACKKLIAKGVKLGYIKEDYKLLAARQLAATESPGAVFYAELKTWPHWSLEL